MTQMVLVVDDVDPTASFFRYPFDKGDSIKVNNQISEMTIGGIIEITPEIKQRDGGDIFIGNSANGVRQVKFKNKKMVEVFEALFKLIDFIFPKIRIEHKRCC